jgi:hypothetical protein
VFGKIAIGVAAALVLLAVVASYVSSDIYCGRQNSEGPKIAGAIFGAKSPQAPPKSG